MKKVLVTGAAGFLGGHLERRLKDEGCFVVSVARKHPPYRKSVADEYLFLDLTNVPDFHYHFFRHAFDEVYQLAGDVGGVGHIGNPDNDADILTNSLKLNLYTLEAIRKTQNVGRIFFSSSQCVYPDRFEIDPFAGERITEPVYVSARPFREDEASFNNYAFAKEKLYAESLYGAYSRSCGLPVRIGRLGNVYGPYGTWSGDRAKAVAAICRKVAEAPYAGSVKLWGDGQASRSFTYVDDAIEGILRLMRSDFDKPVNIAHRIPVSISDLFETVCTVAGKVMAWEPSDGPMGVRHRGSDNTLCRHVLKWEPMTTLWDGLKVTYPWIKEQVEKALTKAES